MRRYKVPWLGLMVFATIASAPLHAYSHMVVNAKGGLRVRQIPDLKGKVVITLKDGESVLELGTTGAPFTISGKTGSWTEISGQNVTGWAFGGFLISAVPKALWGAYCPEGNAKCGQAEYFIDGQMVWQSSEGGCGNIERVEINGDEHQVYCDGKLGVTLKPLSKGRLQLTITGQPSVILKKEK